jgi:C1A family cysteine protease
MGNIVSTINLNKEKIKYLAEEVGFPINLDIQKNNGIIPSDMVDKVNDYIQKVQPEITVGIKNYKLTALLSKITSDMTSYSDYLKSSDGVKAAAAGSSLPKVFLLANVLLPIRDQGNTNCCVAFSTACAIEYKNIMTKNYLDYLSPAFIYTNRKNPNFDNGMNSIDAIQIVKNYGVSTDKIFPMSDLNQSIQPAVYDDAQKYKVITYNYIIDIDTMKIAIYNNGPVMAILPVYNSTNLFWKNIDNKSINQNDIGYHCISIVGYDDINQKFLIRNSWGTNWGTNGYTWLPYSDFNLIVESWTLLPAVSQPDPTLYTTILDNNSNNNDSNKIIGLDPIVFYSLLAGIIVFIIIVIIVIIIRYKQNKQNKQNNINK